MKILALKIYANLLLVYFLFSGFSIVIGGLFTELPKFVPLVWIVFIFLIFIYQIGYIRGQVFKFKLKEYLFWGAVFFFSLTSLLLNDKLYLFTQFFSVFIQVFSAYLIVPLLRGATLDQRSLNSIEKSIEYFCWANVIIVILNFLFPAIVFFGESYIAEGGGRAFGWMGDQIAIIFSFFISIFLAKEKYLKAAIVFIALLATGSIGATFIAIVVGLVYLWQYLKRKKKSQKSQLAILFLGLAFFTVFYFYVIPNATLFNRLSVLNIDPSGEEGVGFHRLTAFQTAVDSWSENKFIGCGFGTYSTIMHKKYDYLLEVYDSSVSITSMVSAFNQYLQFLVEIGLFGLLLAIIFFKGLIKEISLNLKQTKYNFAKGFKIWVVILLVFNQTAVWFLPGSLVLLMFFLGVGLSLSNRIGITIFK